MNVLVIGSGGREHALAWALKRSPSVGRVICAPGNAGMSQLGPCVPINPLDDAAVETVCRTHDVQLVVIGPEDPLVAGLADKLRAQGILVVGPSAKAARIEGSKSFTKDLCARFGIPTARHAAFSALKPARDYAETCPLPVVVKADGLAAGKGVIIAGTREEAIAAVEDMFAGRFGEAGQRVVIEEFLDGQEASFFVLTDGRVVMPLIGAQDHKRVGEGETGPNTGGMGTYSPAPVFDAAMADEVLARIIQPTIEGMARIDAPFEGILYAGLMIGREGPKLIEYNARFGDPECQTLMRRLDGDLGAVFLALAQARLEEASLSWRPETAITVVMAANGYPGAYDKGTEIKGLEAAGAVEGVEIFHAGTRSESGRILAHGGRVLNITALGVDLLEARARAYRAVDRIDWPDGFCRRDIGWRALPPDDAYQSSAS